MKPRVVVYVSADELARMRREAARRRISLSRYAKERLTPDQFEDDSATADNPAGLNQPAAAQLAKTVTSRTDDLAEKLRTVIVMLDQLVKSTLIHLPEIPPAQHKERTASGERRHRSWQQEVEMLLRQLREANTSHRQSAGDGARV